MESSAISTHAEEFFVESDLKDSKKKKRRARKSKQNPSGNRILSLFSVHWKILLPV